MGGVTSGELMMNVLSDSKRASWMAPNGTSRKSEADHALRTLSRPSSEPSTELKAPAVVGSAPDCKEGGR